MDACVENGDCNPGYQCSGLFGPNTCVPITSCGNNIREFPEDCDGTDISQTCQQFGFAIGELACDDVCDLVVGTCADVCGDGIVGQTEQCEGSGLCADLNQGFSGGNFECDPTTCLTITDACLQPVCGDGVAEGFEECDINDFPTITSCTDAGFAAGDLGCDAFCFIDISACFDTCGDGTVGPTENCDSDPGSFTCADLGLVDGTLACDATTCDFDTSACIQPVCGNNVLEGFEQCDTDPTEPCQAFGFAGGTVTCDPEDCFNDTNACFDTCGDGNIGPTERCETDADIFNSCENLGLVGGPLVTCNGCQEDTSACDEPVCGNGVIEGFDEECDTDQFPFTCAEIGGVLGGTLSCDPTSCFIDFSACF